MIQSALIGLLKVADKTCSLEDIKFVAGLFEQHSTGVPVLQRYLAPDGERSYGFYFLFLKQTTVDADPNTFFQILAVDQKIGWTNPVHVESRVFYFKAIKIIQDEKVSDRMFFVSSMMKFILIPELVRMVQLR